MTTPRPISPEHYAIQTNHEQVHLGDYGGWEI